MIASSISKWHRGSFFQCLTITSGLMIECKTASFWIPRAPLTHGGDARWIRPRRATEPEGCFYRAGPIDSLAINR
jgi:hypothetical protein